MSAQPHIVYILSSYPSLREIFYHLEITGLRQEGVDVSVASLINRNTAGTEEWHVQAKNLITIPYLSWQTWKEAGGVFFSHLPAISKAFKVTIQRLWRRPKELIYAGGLSIKAFALAHRLDQQKVQLVHGAWGTWPGYVAWLVHRLKPHIHFTIAYIAYDYHQRFPLTPTIIDDADLVFTISCARRDQLRHEWPKTNEPIAVVYHGMKLPEYSESDIIRKGLLSVGGITPVKGFDVLLDALNILKQEGYLFPLTIIGPTPPEDQWYHEQLRKQIQRLGLQEQVVWRGPQPHPVVMQAMREAALFVLASHGDMLPNVLKEALASGTPVITTDCLGINELVQDGVTGRVVPKDNAPALAGAIADMMRHPQQARSMAQAGEKLVRAEFDIQATSRKRAAYFREVIDG